MKRYPNPLWLAVKHPDVPFRTVAVTHSKRLFRVDVIHGRIGSESHKLFFEAANETS
jgi:hypothetical protein